MYDAENRRFASVDPILDASRYDVSEYVTNPMQLVQYIYVVDNPVRWIDPLGLIWMINPYTGLINNLGDPTYSGRRSLGYYSLDKASKILSYWGNIKYNQKNEKVTVSVVSTDGFTNKSYILEISTKNAEDGHFIPDEDVRVYDATNTNQQIYGRTPDIYYKDGELKISTNGILALMNENSYFKRITCNGTGSYYYLDTRTSAHYDIVTRANKFNVSFEPWKIAHIVAWKATGDDYINRYKINWIKSFAEVIIDAAKKYNISAFAIAQVAFEEVGGDPLFFDNLAFVTRTTLHKNENNTDQWNKNPLYTSYGCLSMQLRRAAETTDYESPLSNVQVSSLIASLTDPVQSIYFAAKHLSYLRTIDFSDISPEDMTEEQWSVTVERYNRGPDISYDVIKDNHGYADRILPFKDEILDYLK